MFNSINLLTLIAYGSRFHEENCLLIKVGDLMAGHITYLPGKLEGGYLNTNYNKTTSFMANVLS